MTDRLELESGPPALHRVLAEPPKSGPVLETFRPIRECLDFRLSRRFWNLRGADAFLGGDVPYLVTNDGHLAAKGVATLLAAAEDLDDEIRVLELGAGSGIFAKQFLDQLREAAPELYARTRYVATDGSEAMVESWSRAGLFAAHPGRVEGRLVELPGLAAGLGDDPPFHAAFANYVLDSLPFSLLAIRGAELWDLEIRTALDEGVDPARYTGLDLEQIAARVASGRPEDLDALVDLYPALVLDARYRRIDRETLPLAHILPCDPDDNAAARARPYLHSHGALRAIAEVADRLAPGGFLCIADYGYDSATPQQDVFEFQHFGGSVAIGLDFTAIDRACAARPGIDVLAPDGDNGQLMFRLVGRDLARATREAFFRVAGKAHWEALTAPLRAAQELTANGQFEAARWKYTEALRLQPHNWALIEEVAGFLTYRLDACEAGLKMAQAGLERNALSPALWNIAGDCLYYSDHLDEAEAAYRHASAISPRDVRSLLNLAWVAERTGRDAEALEFIARGLALDQTDAYRDALLAKQGQILEARGARYRQDLLRSMNRIRGHRDLPAANS